MIRDLGGGRFEVKVYAGRDPLSGKERRVSRTVRGGVRIARERERQLIAEVRQVSPAAKLTVGELLDRWVSSSQHEHSTSYQTQRIIETRIKPRLGTVRLDQLSPQVIERFYWELLTHGSSTGGPLAPSTVIRVHAVLNPALNLAVRWGLVPSNPADKARKPTAKSSRPQSPDAEAVRRLLDAAQDRDPLLYTFIRLAAATGIRRGALCALRWSDVENGRVRKYAALGQGASVYEKPTKTGTVSQMALDVGTQRVLEAHRTKMEDLAARLGTELEPNSFVFAKIPNGPPIRPGTLTARFVRLRNSLGLETKLRNLRHFSATQLLAAGVPVPVVSARLDHARSSTTLNFYAGHIPAQDQLAADHMGEVLG